MDTMLTLGAVLVTALVAPLVLARQMNAARREEKREDWARQDEVAARVVEATEQSKRAAALLVDSNALIADQVTTTTRVTNAKLDVIHTLVNSAMTVEMEGHRAALTALAVLVPPDSEQGQQVAAQIAVLDASLAERAAAAERAAGESPA